ncbi:sensor histidine kinase [Heyndrickxia camelliae]|nr:HAMP domain-containing sensor histidine kinase [Heyndrickxia camelliae]
MLLITVWQFNAGILYFEAVLSKETILFLLKVFRFGPTFAIPVVYYMAFIIIKGQPTILKEKKWLNKISNILLNQKVFVLLIVWSVVVYLITWTPFGTEGLFIAHNRLSHISYYFPKYGPLMWVYIVHTSSFFLFLVLVFVISRRMLNSSIKKFLTAFILYSTLLYIFGLLNFSSDTGIIFSSIGVIIFSTLIVMEFLKLSINIKANYYEIMERQKKLDYTGNLAGSMIHEVKNTNQIIKGFAQMLSQSNNLDEKDQGLLEMIEKSSKHLTDLTDSYKTYMKTSTMAFAKENLESIIQESIEFSSGILREYQTNIDFRNNYHSLYAYVNKTNLKQVFINLIKNSVEAIPEDRKNKKITIEIELDNKMFIIHFKDTGSGISPENWESVFNPFMSLKTKGMGLGLPFVKKIIIEHLGNINIVESSPEGTHFQIEIPQNGILNLE